MPKVSAHRTPKPLLWFSALSCELEPVTNRHKTPCSVCGNLPTGMRMVLSHGSGLGAIRLVLCSVHADKWFQHREAEARRGRQVLAGLASRIRLLSSWSYLKAARKAKEISRKLKKESNNAQATTPVAAAMQASKEADGYALLFNALTGQAGEATPPGGSGGSGGRGSRAKGKGTGKASKRPDPANLRRVVRSSKSTGGA